MKYKKIIPVLLIFNLFLTSCGNFNEIKKNKLVVEKINLNNKISNKSKKNKILSEEEAKLRALEILDEYFNIKLYLTEVQCYVEYKSSDQIRKLLNLGKLNNNGKINSENIKNILENGIYNIIIMYKKQKIEMKEEFQSFSIQINSITGELLSFRSYGYKEKELLDSDLNIKQAEIIAKEFIEKNNIYNIKKVKFIEKNHININSRKYNVYKFLLEDSENKNKKISINIDGNSKEICKFSIEKLISIIE